MFDISAQADALLGSDAVAHVWTHNPDGSPQVSVVWVIARGDEILFGTDTASQKAKNLRQDSRIVLSIEDTERNERGFQRHLVVRGRAEIEAGPDPALMDQALAATRQAVALDNQNAVLYMLTGRVQLARRPGEPHCTAQEWHRGSAYARA